MGVELRGVTTAAAEFLAPMFSAAAVVEKRPAVVSVHDVAPPTWQKSARIVEELRRFGIGVCSLLVVPDYHHSGLSMENAKFVKWLRDCEEDGHEIVAHGYYHQRDRRESESVRDMFITRLYTSDEGEFYDLAYAEARERVGKARAQFEGVGLKPCGFIAPAWLLGAEAELAVADEGFEYTTRLTSVRDLRIGADTRARSLVHSVRDEWRRKVSLAWNAMLFRHLGDAPLLRLGLHPPDLDHTAIWRQVEAQCRAISDTHTPTTYRDWIADRRSTAAYS